MQLRGVIWGFDLSELSFSAFTHAKLFDPRWHLRRERIVLYQLGMLISLAAECAATYSLAKYEGLQGNIENGYPGAHLYQNDLIDAEILTIVFCVLVSCLFGADFFFLAQFPRQVYPVWYQTIKKGCAVFITLGMIAACILSAVVVGSHSARLSGISASTEAEALALYYRPPLQYNRFGTNIAYVVLLWIGTVFVIASTWIMFAAADYDALHGTDPIEIVNKYEGMEQGERSLLEGTQRHVRQ